MDVGVLILQPERGAYLSRQAEVPKVGTYAMAVSKARCSTWNWKPAAVTLFTNVLQSIPVSKISLPR